MFRLQMSRPVDLSMTSHLLYLCWRHNIKYDHARPSINRIASDLGCKPRTTKAVIQRLEDSGLIHKNKGIGRGRTTRYKLPWLQHHLMNPSSDDPIPWNTEKGQKRTSKKVHDSVEKGTSGCTVSTTKGTSERHKGCNTASKKGQQDVPEKNKNIKSSQDHESTTVSESVLHDITTECIKANIRENNWVEMTMMATNLGYIISAEDRHAINQEIKDRHEKKSQGASQ